MVLAQELPTAALQGRDIFVLHDMLARHPRTGAVILDRMDFGCNGHRDPPDELVIRAYTKRVLALRPLRHAGKPFVRLEALERMQGAHSASVLPTWYVFTADSAPWNGNKTHRTFEPFRLNHYKTRSYAECVEKSNSSRLSATNWRVKFGPKLCDAEWEDSTLYRREEHAVDAMLAISWHGELIHAVMRLLPAAAGGRSRS